MANDRGHYGSRSPRVGSLPTIYVEHGGASIGTLLLGAVAIGGGLLWARHQSRQIEQLYKTSGTPYQTFAGSLSESAKELPTRARAAYHGFVRPAPPLPSADAPAHSVKRLGRS